MLFCLLKLKINFSGMQKGSKGRNSPSRSSPISSGSECDSLARGHAIFGSRSGTSTPRARKFSSRCGTPKNSPFRARLNSASDSASDQSVERFAGARFNSPPMPAAVPLPPMEWLMPTVPKNQPATSAASNDELCQALAKNLKEMLNFKA